MKIEIPNDILKKADLIDRKCQDIVMELVNLGERVPEEVTGAKHPIGVLIYVKEDLPKR